MGVKEILSLFPLRVGITDFCNLNCFFCSNEGMPKEKRNLHNIDKNSLDFLLSSLKNEGLSQIALTGGEPTMHPEIKQIVQMINGLGFDSSYFHTNGVYLNPDLIRNNLENFSKIGVSLNSCDYNVWKKLSQGNYDKFQKLIYNLNYLGESGLASKVEIKHIPLKGFNDSEDSMKQTLDFCSKFGFKFKFLNFEPIELCHVPYSVPVSELGLRLESVGCTPVKNDSSFRGQQNYLPIRRYSYGKSQGVLIEIGCGTEEACSYCHKSHEIFITPDLKIKPCHTNSFEIPLSEHVNNRDVESIKQSIAESRLFLEKSDKHIGSYWRHAI